MIDWDLVLAYAVGMLTVFVPLAIGSVWRECRKRNDQRHELDMKQLDVQADLVRRVMASGYELELDEVPDIGELPVLKRRLPSETDTDHNTSEQPEDPNP